MKKLLIILFANLALLLFQESFTFELFGSSLNPNLIAALGFAFLFADDDSNATKSIFIGSILLDLIGVGVVGLTLVFYIVIFQLAIYVRNFIFKGVGTPLVFLLISTILYKMAVENLRWELDFRFVLSAVITLMISFVFYLVINRFRQRFISSEYRIRA